MRYGVLGPVEAWLAGEPLALGGQRQLSLFAFLVLHANRVVTSDELTEAVWGSSREGAGKRLSVSIARLRRALGPIERDRGGPIVQTAAGGYLLALAPGELDADRFEALVAEGRAALDAGEGSRAASVLREALGLWRGLALAQVRFEAFAQAEVRRLDELRLLALEARIDADLQLGVDRHLIAELEALLTAHPTREHVAGQLMLALYRSGRQTDALEVYTRERARLISELGIEPGPALRALHVRILEQAPAIEVTPDRDWGLGSPRPIPLEPVTMVIAELKTSSSPGADDPRLAERTARLDEGLRDLWSRHGALRIAERAGRRLAVFGSPAPALAAAQESVERSAGPRPAPEDGACLRVGVHTGPLRVSAAGFWGEDILYAARLAEVAHPGQILVSAATAALAPGAALVELGEYRLSGDSVPRRLFGLGGGPHPLPLTSDPLRSNLPVTHGELIGRELELSELTAALSDGTSRIVTITGAGGSGKTRLALAVAEAGVDLYVDGAFFVPLAQVSEPAAVAAAIAAPLGIHLHAEGGYAEAIGVALADRQLLLVLDNFEHLIGAAPLIVELVTLAPRLRVLVTSQAPLRVRGERVLALGPLDVPEHDDPRSVAAAAAGRLLIERARETDPGFELTVGNAEGLAGLCRALGGSPLAIELAAARLALLSPDQLLARLDQGLDAIGQGGRDLPQRQRGLRAALDWTHALLGEDYARLLRRLGVFAGPVPLERIERVCGDGGDLLDVLSQLVDLSLVNRTPDGRFLLNATVRAYAREKLAAAGEEEESARRHAEAHAEAAMGWGTHFLFDVGAVHFAVLGEEADITQALAWSAVNDQECFARLAGGASMPLHIVARLLPWSEMIEQALLRDAVTGTPRVWLLLAASLVAFERGDQQLACARLESMIAAADEAQDAQLARLMRTCSIIFKVLTGVTEGIRDEHTLLSELVAEADDRDLAELVRGLEAYVLGYCEGRYAEAGVIWAAQIADRGRTDFAGWTALYCWPDCPLLDGDYGAAFDGFRAALRSARERGQSPTVAYQLEGMSMALSGLGRHEQALEAAGWAASVRQTTGPAPNSWYRMMLERALADSRAALDADTGQLAYARGRALSLDAAVNAGLRLGSVEVRAPGH